MKTPHVLVVVTGCAMALAVASCGGGSNGNGGTPPVVTQVPVTQVPDSASVSTSSFVSYVQTLGATDESTEALTIKDTFAVPVDETSEPTPLT
jgi:hypothetical protein